MKIHSRRFLKWAMPLGAASAATASMQFIPVEGLGGVFGLLLLWVFYQLTYATIYVWQIVRGDYWSRRAEIKRYATWMAVGFLAAFLPLSLYWTGIAQSPLGASALGAALCGFLLLEAACVRFTAFGH